jgi:hypothetical protein
VGHVLASTSNQEGIKYDNDDDDDDAVHSMGMMDIIYKK